MCLFLDQAVKQHLNVALGKVTRDSSAQGSCRESKNAVDGVSDTDLLKCSCTHTAPMYAPWWCVDLHNIYKVHSVNITNRECELDCGK